MAVLQLKEEEITKKIGAIQNIAQSFSILPEQYEGIIEELRAQGWQGPSNSDFLSRSEEYKTNINTVSNDLLSFRDNFVENAEAAADAI